MSKHDDSFDATNEVPFGENGNNPLLPPEGYFDTFSRKLMARIEAEEELKEFALLSSVPKQAPFTVPDSYFENAAGCSEELVEYAQLGKIARPAYVPVEEAYFEVMQQQVMYKAELADELKTYPVLHAMDKQQMFAVPPAYFEDLADLVKARIHAGASEPVVGLLERVVAFVLRPRVALSFSLALVVGLGFVAYNRSGHTAQPVAGDCQTLACLEKSDVLNDNTIHSLDDESLFDIVDVNVLNRQISKDVAKPDTVVQEQYLIDNMNTDQLMEEL